MSAWQGTIIIGACCLGAALAQAVEVEVLVDFFAIPLDAARRLVNQSRHQAQESRLAAPTGSHQRNEAAFFDLKRGALQRNHFFAERLRQCVRFNDDITAKIWNGARCHRLQCAIGHILYLYDFDPPDRPRLRNTRISL